MKWPPFQWSDLSGFYVVIAACIGLVIAGIRVAMRTSFVSLDDHREVLEEIKSMNTRADGFDDQLRGLVEKRLSGLEMRVATLPTQQDLGVLADRLRIVEVTTSSTNATVQATEKTVGGIAHQLNILFQNELAGGRHGAG